jgi:hypothetical protein
MFSTKFITSTRGAYAAPTLREAIMEGVAAGVPVLLSQVSSVAPISQ